MDITCIGPVEYACEVFHDFPRSFPGKWAQFKHARCKATNLIRKTKRNYFCDKIDENKGNPKGIWKAIRSLTGTGKSQVNINELVIGDETITDKSLIVNELNKYFTNITANIGNEHDTNVAFNDENLKNFVSSRLNTDETSYEIPLLTPEQVLDIIKKIPSNKATGNDEISVKLLKEIAPVFINPLCKLMNISITTNAFPTKWKVAKVTPLHKDGPRNDRNNYRPISVLSVFSKILEKHVARSFINFLRDNKLLYKYQSAFRGNHSTETALIRLTDQILFNMDNDEITALVFLDFRKAFDVINHDLLLKKLSIYGVGNSTVGWFRSYLSERRQFVKLGKTISTQLPVIQGVPQGSVLGPVLFLLFVNDMPLEIINSTIDIYADDTTLLSCSKWNDITLNQTIAQDLNNIEKWAIENKMFLNAKKTKSMLVSGKRLRKRLSADNTNLNITLTGKNIEQVANHKILGVNLDQDLTFETHVEELCKKLSKRLGLLRRISSYLKQKQKAYYYEAVIKPLLLYGSPIWSSSNKGNLDNVLRMQKRAARIILEAERRTPSVTMFNTLEWVPFYTEVYVNRCTLAYKRLNGLTPNYINSLLKTNSEVHSVNTRYSHLNFVCPNFNRTTEGGRTFSVRTIKDWNALPPAMKQSVHAKCFKTKLFNSILEEQKLSSSF